MVFFAREIFLAGNSLLPVPHRHLPDPGRNPNKRRISQNQNALVQTI